MEDTLKNWHEAISDKLYDAEDDNKIIELQEDYHGSTVKDNLESLGLPPFLEHIYKDISNGFEITWRDPKDETAGGRMSILPFEHVIRDGLGYTYQEEDLIEEELLQYFKPFDQITDEMECGFLLNPAFQSNSIYLKRINQPDLYNLNIDMESYFELAKEAGLFFYWPKVILDIKNCEERQETINFKKNMPKIFPDFSWNNFVELYKELKLE